MIARSLRHPAGFSLIELLVSVVIGMIALVFATRMVAGTDQSRQGAIGGSDSMQNGMLAMFSISQDAAQAGWGLNDDLLNGCDTLLTDTGGYTLPQASRGAVLIHPLAPAVIESNDHDPDRISLFSGSAMSGMGNARLMNNYTGGTQLDIDRKGYGFGVGDVIVVAPETPGSAKCAVGQVSSDPGATPSLTMATGGTMRFNDGSLDENYIATQARVFNLGPAATLSFHTWSVANGYLQLSATNVQGSGAQPSSVADNVVSIKAQYGFDTRSVGTFAPQSGLEVNRWSPVMVDADGDGTVGSAGDYQRIAAVRIAVVARGRSPEKPGTDGLCTATSAQPTVFAATEPTGVAPQPMQLNVAVPGEPDGLWKCYRYRVFETIVPLRNAAWRPYMFPTFRSQRGIALPVMLIIVAVMLVGGVYLFKSANSTTLTTANLAYDAAQSRAVDYGLHQGFQWLSTSAKAGLTADQNAAGYTASLNTALQVSDDAFWNGSVTVNDPAGNRIEYVIHRMCKFPGAFDDPANTCVLSPDGKQNANGLSPGSSMAGDAVEYTGGVQLHYVITARIFGTRGGNVVNQAVVMMGA